MESSILLTDDSETDRYIFKRMLNSEWSGLPVFEQGDGSHAMDFLIDFAANKKKHGDKFPPVVILLDINMPLMDGFEFLDKFSVLRENDPRYSSVVIMMLSSSHRKEDIERATAYDCVKGYVIKGEADQKALSDCISPYL